MNVRTVTIVDYFKEKIQYVIPLFQRTYTWENAALTTLWEDLIGFYDNVDKDRHHFMGTIVTISSNDNRNQSQIPESIIIDGQQRLLTFSILLCVLRDKLKKTDIELSNQIQALLTINCKDSNVLKFIPAKKDKKAYQFLIEYGMADSKSTSLINNCYRFFYRKLSDFTLDGNKISPIQFYKLVQDVPQVVMISLGKNDNPYAIFESLNGNGTPLTNTDFIRNYFLMKFGDSPDSEENQILIYDDILFPVESLLGKEIEHFLWDYIKKETGKKIAKKKIYEEIRNIYDLYDKDQTFDKLCLLKRDAENFDTFLHPEKAESPEIVHQLQLLNRMQLQVTYPFLLKLHTFLDSKKIEMGAYLECLKILNSYLLRRSICQKPTNELNRLIPSLCFQINNVQRSLEIWLKKTLSSLDGKLVWPDDNEFCEYIKKTNLEHNKNAIPVFFSEIEKYLSGIDMYQYVDAEIEYIMPISLSKDWKSILGDNASEICRKYKDCLGNITFLESYSNIPNPPFRKKRELYENSQLKITSGISKFTNWTINEIMERSEELAAYALKIWQSPAICLGGPNRMNFNEIWTGQIPRAISINGETKRISEFKKIYVYILAWLEAECNGKFMQFVKRAGLFGRFSQNPQKFYTEVKKDMYVYSNLSAEDIRNNIITIAHYAGISLDDVYIEIISK